MGKITHITVKVSVESIRDSLRKKIVSEHSTLIANVILGNLISTEVGLQQLYKALSGVEDKFKYKVGDIVLAKTDALRTWAFDLKGTDESGLVKQNRIRGQITDIYPHKSTPYAVEIDVIKNTEQVKISSEVSEESICLEEEWPGSPDNPDNNDLPF